MSGRSAGFSAAATSRTPQTLHRLAEGLGVKVDEFFRRSGPVALPPLRPADQSRGGRSDRDPRELFDGWTEADFDELHSRVGTGGALTVEGTLRPSGHMNQQTRAARKTRPAPGKQPRRSGRRASSTCSTRRCIVVGELESSRRCAGHCGSTAGELSAPACSLASHLHYSCRAASSARRIGLHRRVRVEPLPCGGADGLAIQLHGLLDRPAQRRKDRAFGPGSPSGRRRSTAPRGACPRPGSRTARFPPAPAARDRCPTDRRTPATAGPIRSAAPFDTAHSGSAPTPASAATVGRAARGRKPLFS